MAGIDTVRGADIVRARIERKRPVLGICVGMQVLFDAGNEHGVETAGIGVLRGRVERLDAPVLPHMGWNTVSPAPRSTLFAGVESERFYFVHSYAVAANGHNDTVARHGNTDFVAAVERETVVATQFHPEKSGDAGLQLLRNWVQTLGE
jgi:glutamine amidotransferase